MKRIHGFPPLSQPDARILILGSMPGKVSLRDVQYYAHTRNAFWRIMATLLGSSAEDGYEQRVKVLLNNRIALWDVLQSCTRESSLDADIDETSIIPNDFAAFFAAHPGIEQVFFNGAKAEASFMRHVKPGLPRQFAGLVYCRLPSTSPANAAYSWNQKLEAWGKVLDNLRLPSAG